VALSAGYVLRESAGNLRRNVFMTIAAILCMAVSLTALGAVLVMRQAIHTLSLQSEGGVELAIFLQPNVSPTQASAIHTQLASTPGVKRFHFVDKQAAYKEFKQIFQGDPDVTGALTAGDMPPSFRVVPTQAQDVVTLGNLFKDQPGVLRVSYPAEEVRNLVAQAQEWKLWGFVLAIVVLVAAVALIVNTIQLAIFARRREVAVMKLVGATNMFIRVPFMLEGLIHGIAGAILGFLVVYFARDGIAGFLPSWTFIGGHLRIPASSAVLDGIAMLVLGALVGMGGSAFAVRRYLAV
jgi:cell division transport system permease protein